VALVDDSDISECISGCKLQRKLLQKWCGVAKVVAIKWKYALNEHYYIALKLTQKCENNQ